MIDIKQFKKSLRKQETYLRNSVYGKFYWWIEKDPIKCLPTILRYYRIIEGNFLEWLIIAMTRTKNETAKEIMRKNVLCEVSDNHPKLLKEWFEAIILGYTQKFGDHIMQHEIRVFDEEKYEIQNISYNIKCMRSVCDVNHALIIIALLEHYSQTFIRLFWELAKKLGYQESSESMKYLQVHGAADAKHAQDALLALIQEFEHMETGKFLMDHSCVLVIAMLEYIFTTPKFE